jgi:TetR/AcrR family transcriptional regulator of autoinduction and epiphytic fitness
MTLEEGETRLSLVPPLVEVTSTDGRVARGQRTRQRLAEALVELLHAGDADPTAKAVAEQAGVSLRLVFHHFTDMDDLYGSVVTLALEQQRVAIHPIAADLSLDDRIQETVEQRSRFFEEVSPVRRAALRRCIGSGEVMATLAVSNAWLMDDLAATFAPELHSSGNGESVLLVALDAVSSWEAWDRLRHGSGLALDVAACVMTRTLDALLHSN